MISEASRAREAVLDWLANEGGIDVDVLEAEVRPLLMTLTEAAHRDAVGDTATQPDERVETVLAYCRVVLLDTSETPVALAQRRMALNIIRDLSGTATPADQPEQAQQWVVDPHCVEQWPECQDGDYNPACCRFPKECSCLIDPERLARRVPAPADQPDETTERGAALTALVLRDIADHLARGEVMADGYWKPYVPPSEARLGAKYRRGYSDRGLVAVHALRSIAEMNDPTRRSER